MSAFPMSEILNKPSPCPYCHVDLEALNPPFSFAPMNIAGRKQDRRFHATHRCPKCRLLFEEEIHERQV